MIWNNIADNSCITHEDLRTNNIGVYLKSGQTESSSSNLITKTELTTKYNLDTVNLNSLGINDAVKKNLIYNTTLNCGSTSITIYDYGIYQGTELISGQTYDTYLNNRVVNITSSGNSTLSLGMANESNGDVIFKRYIIFQNGTPIYNSGWVNISAGSLTFTPSLSLSINPIYIEMYSAWTINVSPGPQPPVAGPPITGFTYLAEYLMLTYQFTDGKDLDTRTRIVSPDVGQNTQNTYLGWARQNRWPLTGNPYLLWAGDNTLSGYESVLINVTEFKIQNPTQSELLLDLRAFWFDTQGYALINVAATLWQGGSPAISTGQFIWTNPTATGTFNVGSSGKAITLITNQQNSSGERAATLNYNVNTGVGNFNSNDNITISV